MIPINKYTAARSQRNYSVDSSASPGSISSSSSVSSDGSGSPSSGDNGVFLFPVTDNGMDVKSAQLRKSINKLGGMYTSGKPLPLSIRREIVAMAETGMKACDISRHLQISHGCVSKIISKWRITGSFEPRRIGGSKPKKTLPEVIGAVRMYKRACPSIHSLEIRRRLLADEICTDQNVPSLSSINRIIRMKLRDEVAEFEASAVRDLMALLTGSTAAEIHCHANSPMESKPDRQDDQFESPESPAPSESHATIAPDQSIQKSPTDQSIHHAINRMDTDLSNIFNTPSDTHSYPDHPNTSRPSDEIRRHRPDQIFTNPYGDYSLGTPVFNETNPESDPRLRNLDANGLVFSFDFEEDVWSWLDQIP